MQWTGSLVERGGELDALQSALKRSASAGEVVVIEGPAGIGKSRLIEAIRHKSSGCEVLSGRGGALEGDLPFGVVRQLFEPVLNRAGAEEREALLAGSAAPSAQVLGLAGAAGQTMAGDLPRSLNALFWFVANLAERTSLLIAVDDLHWSDRASLEFLVYLARRIDGLPALLVAAVRDGEVRAHEAALAELASHATLVRPMPLTAAGVADLIRVACGAPAPPELVEACRTATGGNPFYLGELLKAVVPPSGDLAAISLAAIEATVPSTVARSILLRLGRLGDAPSRLATAAALLGDGSPLRHAAALAEVSSADAEQAADDLVSASILMEVHPLRFAHPIVRSAIAGDLLPGGRAAMHRRAAEILHGAGERVERIVPHLLNSSPSGDRWVVETLHRAAGEAMERGVPDVAVSYLRRALDEPASSGQARLLADLSVAELAAGAYVESASSARRAIEAQPDPGERARFRLHQVSTLASVEGGAPALRCLEQGMEEAKAAVDEELALRLEAELVVTSWLVETPHPVHERISRHRNLPGRTPAERLMLSVLAMEAVGRDEPADVVRDLALRGWDGGRLLGDSPQLPLAFWASAIALLAAEAYDETRDLVSAAIADCVTRGAEYGFGGVCWVRGLLSVAEGNLTAAEADERMCVEHAVPTMVGIGVAALALVLLEQGDVAAAEAELERGGLLTDDRPLYVWGPYVRGCVRLAQRRAEEALADFRDVGRQATEVGGFAVGLQWGAGTALALHALGDEAGAQQAAAAERDRAERRGGARGMGVALRTCGAVSSGGEQLARLGEAVEVLEGSRARLELARARFDLGVALLRVGRRRAGRELLEKSYDGARGCGARGLAQSAYGELRVAGARPRRLTFSGVDSITASERRVAEMAAAGLSNREIATALFVTPKTVENQLGRVYRKLGVSSRRVLGDVLQAE